MRQSATGSRVRAHPLVLASVLVLVLNDHLLKARWPGPVTGIASDVAGLILLPVALVLAADAVSRQPLRSRTVAAIAAAVAAGFAAVELVPVAERAYEIGLGIAGWPVRALFGGAGLRVDATADPTDLLALPAAAAVVWLWSRAAAARRPRRVGALVVVALAPALLATSKPAPDPVTTADASKVVALDAQHPAASLIATVRAEVGAAVPVDLLTGLPHPTGEPEVLLTKSVVDGPGATEVQHRSTRDDWTGVADPADALALGTCKATCTWKVRIVVQLVDPKEGAWRHAVGAQALVDDDGVRHLAIDLAPETAPPRSDVDRIVARGTLQGAQGELGDEAKALVLRIRGSSEALGQLRLSAVSNGAHNEGDHAAIVPPVAPKDPADVAWDPFIESGTLGCPAGTGTCERYAAFLPEWTSPTAIDVSIIRSGPAVDGATIELVDATWLTMYLGSHIETAGGTAHLGIIPGDHLVAAVRQPAADHDEHLTLTMKATTSTGATVDPGPQPALTFIETCPATRDGLCESSYDVSADGVGRIEIDWLTIPS
jgi:hypothetical protein